MTRSAPHLATLVVLTALSVLSLNMFLPALPAMRAHFEVSEAVMGRAISYYMAAAACLQLVLGPISDRLGRRPVVLAMLAVFALASLACLISQNITVFLIARTVQAVAVGGGVLASATVRDMFDGREAASKLALIASAMAVAPMLAPMLGGFLDAALGWRAIFAVYAGLGLAILVWIWIDLGETHMIGTGKSQPAISGLITQPLFWAYAGCQALGVGAFFIFLTGAPFVAADVFGLGPGAIGIGLGSITAGYMLGAGLSAALVARLGPMQLIFAGRVLPLCGLGLGLAVYGLGSSSILPLFTATMTVGLGNGLTVANANAGALSIRPDLAGSAAGIVGAFTLTAGAGLTAVATMVLSHSAAPVRLLALMICAVLASLICALAARHLERRSGP